VIPSDAPWWQRILRGVSTTPMPHGRLRGDGSLPLPVRLGLPLNEYLEDLTIWRSMGLVKYEGAVVVGLREVALQHAGAALAQVLTSERATVTAAMRQELGEIMERAVSGTYSDVLEIMTTAAERTIQHQAHLAGEMEDVWNQYRGKLADLPPWRVPPVGGFELATQAKDPNWMLADLFKDEYVGSVAQIRQQVMGGYLSGQSVQDLARDLKKTFGGQAADWARLSRTSLHRIGGEYDRHLHEQNSDVLAGVKFIATLDDITCPICGEEDGEVYDVGEAPRVPLHPNCRCKIGPVTKSVREILGLGAGGKVEDPDGVRMSMDGLVPKSLAWPEWMEKKEREAPEFGLQPLGEATYRAWVAGKIALGPLTARGRVRSWLVWD